MGHRSSLELNIVSNVLVPRMTDDVRIDVNSDRSRSHPGKRVRSIPFAAREVQHLLVSNKLRRIRVPMQMLVLPNGCVFHPRKVPLACGYECSFLLRDLVRNGRFRDASRLMSGAAELS
jgi:hypothetical protein